MLKDILNLKLIHTLISKIIKSDNLICLLNYLFVPSFQHPFNSFIVKRMSTRDKNEVYYFCKKINNDIYHAIKNIINVKITKKIFIKIIYILT